MLSRRHLLRAIALPSAPLLLVLACSTTPDASSSGTEWDETTVHVTAPAPQYKEAPEVVLPKGVTSIDAITVDQGASKLYVASGSQILVAGAEAQAPALTLLHDMATEGITQAALLAALSDHRVIVASASKVVFLSAAGAVESTAELSGPFSGAFAVSPDGSALFLVESGGGSKGASGDKVAHVARFDLTSKAPQLSPAEVFEIGAPFEIAPASVGPINASSPVVSGDGEHLYVAHVIFRYVVDIAVSAPHAVTLVDLDSLQRSATSMWLGADGLLVQAALFDETVPVFHLESAEKATFLAEIPVGTSPQAVAGIGKRVFVGMGAGFGGPPGGGFPGGAGPGGGFPGGSGAGGGFPGGSGGGKAALRVFDLD
jgi:hypothetical protein